MRQLRYHGNFCTECGNPLARRRHWLPRFFCDECTVQMRRRQRLPSRSWLWVLLLAAGGLFYLLNQPVAPPAVAPTAAQSLATIAPVAPTVGTTLSNEVETVWCGARTRKGTPCRRLVKAAGQRCAQHRGRPSLY